MIQQKIPLRYNRNEPLNPHQRRRRSGYLSRTVATSIQILQVDGNRFHARQTHHLQLCSSSPPKTIHLAAHLRSRNHWRHIHNRPEFLNINLCASCSSRHICSHRSIDSSSLQASLILRFIIFASFSVFDLARSRAMATVVASMSVAGAHAVGSASVTSESTRVRLGSSHASLGGVRLNVATPRVSLRARTVVMVRADDGVVDKVEGAVGGAYGKMKDAVGGAKGKVEEAAGAVKGKAEEAKDKAGDVGRDAQQNAEKLGDKASDAGRDLEGSVKNASRDARGEAENLGNKAQGAVEDAGDSVKRNADKATSSAQDAGKDVRRKAEDAGSSAQDAAHDLKRDAQKGADRMSN